MANHAIMSCIDETCCKVMCNNTPFGGKTVLLLGDFQQTCPVIYGSSKAQIIDACLKSSPLWPLFTLFRLIQPIRNAEDLEFANFVDSIGEGSQTYPSLHMLDLVQDQEQLIDFAFPSSTIQHPLSCVKCSILVTTNDQVRQYNNTILHRIHGKQRTYLAADSIKEAQDTDLPPPDSSLDYITHQTPAGLPDHNLVIKTNCVFCLLHNFSIHRQLVKNMRVIVVDLGNRLITVRLTKQNDSPNSPNYKDILIPRITFTHHLHSGHELLRRQFPLAPAYATTFNSCQGLTLDVVTIDLTHPVFSHGLLYTALSRV